MRKRTGAKGVFLVISSVIRGDGFSVDRTVVVGRKDETSSAPNGFQDIQLKPASDGIPFPSCYGALSNSTVGQHA